MLARKLAIVCKVGPNPQSNRHQQPQPLLEHVRGWRFLTQADPSSSLPRFKARENEMRMLHKATPERLSAFSDGVFAVLITVLVLDLHPPQQPTFEALLALWPQWLSYAVSYLFIAIVWTNHHYLLRYCNEATHRLLWFNFAHLFSMSLLPLSTAWMAVSELAPQPVAFYAAVFF